MKIKKVSIAILLLLFLAVSFFFIDPITRQAELQYYSKQLITQTIKNENVERTDYIDPDGQIAIAANLGYATKIVTKTGNSKLEQYFDDKGEPISCRNGYYALLQEFDDDGNNTHIAYLNLSGEPEMMAKGYAIEIREYNENRQVLSVRYYDSEGKPVLTPSYGYGMLNEYDENGKNIRITYIDANGAPMMNGQGYAIVSRCYYQSDGSENGKVESEYYFDESGNPIALYLGQFGVRFGYDEYGRSSVLTYLDADGKPIITNKGYTTVRRTYQADNSIAEERYYDLEGDPIHLSEGQYGYRMANGQRILLNQFGKEVFNVSNQLYNCLKLLHNRSIFVIVFAMMVVALASITNRLTNITYLILYLGAIVFFTLLFRENHNRRVNLTFFAAYKKLFTDDKTRADILKNIWLFIPLGAILYRLCPKKGILLIPVVLSILIEIIQYCAGIGICEFDDVISNSLGGIIGFLSCNLLCELKNMIFARSHCKMK